MKLWNAQRRCLARRFSQSSMFPDPPSGSQPYWLKNLSSYSSQDVGAAGPGSALLEKSHKDEV